MKILFVCKGNIARSQMADIIFNKLSKRHYAISAGTVVGSHEGQKIDDMDDLSDQYVIDCMKEIGLDVSEKTRKQLTKDMVEKADKIIVMAEIETIPNYLKNSKKTIFWNIENPKGKSLEEHRLVRDRIKTKVEELIKELNKK